jgi:hypothetical protein
MSCFVPNRLRTRTCSSKAQMPLDNYHSFFSWNKAQWAAVKWYLSTLKLWSASEICGQRRSDPILGQYYFGLFCVRIILPFGDARRLDIKSHKSPPKFFKGKNVVTLNKSWRKKTCQSNHFFYFCYVNFLKTLGSHKQNGLIQFLLLSPKIISQVFLSYLLLLKFLNNF